MPKPEENSQYAHENVPEPMSNIAWDKCQTSTENTLFLKFAL